MHISSPFSRRGARRALVVAGATTALSLGAASAAQAAYGDLQTLTLDGGATALTPAFAPGTTAYSASVPFSKTSVVVRGRAESGITDVSIDGGPRQRDRTQTVNLGVGSNPIALQVRDSIFNFALRGYGVNVTRRAAVNLTTAISADSTGAGTFTCTVSAASVPCGSNFDDGTVVDVTAVPGTGSVPAGFTPESGCTLVGASTCRVTLDVSRTVTARFSAQSALVVTPSLDGNAQLRAVLTNASSSAPLAGQVVTFSAPNQNGVPTVLCTATTNAQGVATCNGGTNGRLFAGRAGVFYTATFAGAGDNLPTSGTARLATPRTA